MSRHEWVCFREPGVTLPEILRGTQWQRCQQPESWPESTSNAPLMICLNCYRGVGGGTTATQIRRLRGAQLLGLIKTVFPA